MPHLQTPAGVVIGYDLVDCTDPWRVPGTVVLVHGFSKNRRFWYEWVPALCRRFRVLCLDLRGHGESSPWPDGAPMALQPFVDDLAAFLDGLGIDAAHFVMAEFSSSVAVEFAIAHPGRVRRLVLPGFGYNWKGAAVDPRAWAALVAREGVAEWARRTNADRLPADADPALRAWYVAEQARMPARFMQALFEFSAGLDLTERLPRVTQPVLVIGGSLARQDTADSVRRGVRLMPHGRLVMLEGLPFNVMTAAPARCVAETLAFLGEEA